eukprot:TRINITY_DN5846_c0_g1_i1.p1 TRINITY_DN5846_c0_g1~~TRINITY_DN5846_c0_g1_i1.p1  ORF type:complete len:686 (+),score=204.69 TRINITY_DN5846_c0_g1_i1:23-2080(+)
MEITGLALKEAANVTSGKDRDEYVVYRDEAISILKHKKRSKLGSRVLFLRLAFLIIYMVALALQQTPERIANIVKPVQSNWDPSFNGINSPIEWYDWMRGTFSEAVFVGTDPSGQPLPLREINLVAQASKLMSPVVIERTNGGEDDCDGRFTDVFPECFDDSFEELDLTIDETTLNSVVFNESLFLVTNDYSVIVIPGNVSDSGAVNLMISFLQNQNWIDRTTRSIRVSFVLYNGNWNVFIRNDLTVLFTTSGTVRKEMLISPAKLELYEDRVDKFRGFLEVFLITSIVGFMVFEIYYIPMKRNKSFWRCGNIDKMLWFLLFLACAALWAAIIGVFDAVVIDTTTLLTDIENTNGIFLSIKLFTAYRVLSAINLLFTLFLVVKDMRLSTNLSLVSRAINRAAADLVFFLFLFFVVFFTYAFIGFYYFAEVDPQFVTYLAAIESLFQWLLGQVIFDTLYKASPGVGHLYCWGFVIVLIFLLFNMLIAIIIDAYGFEKEQTAKLRKTKLGIIEEFKSLDAKRRKKQQQKGKLTTEQILERLQAEDMELERVLTKADLQQITDWSDEQISAFLKKFGEKNTAGKLPREQQVLMEEFEKQMQYQMAKMQQEILAQVATWLGKPIPENTRPLLSPRKVVSPRNNNETALTLDDKNIRMSLINPVTVKKLQEENKQDKSSSSSSDSEPDNV